MKSERTLRGKVAVVTGATRGAGRGIACMLGEAGATVYCTGRSMRGKPSPYERPETIEETAEMVTAHGGKGIWVQIDHKQPDQVSDLFDRVDDERNRQLDIVVNNIPGDSHLEWITQGFVAQPFWKHTLDAGLSVQQSGVHTHIITNHYAARRMIKNSTGLIVEISDGNCLQYNCNLYNSLAKTSLILLAYFMAEELRRYNVAAVALTPGWLRSEAMLESFNVTADTWKEAIEGNPDFANSETPFYVGRAVVALATDMNIMDRTGHALSSGYLAREYGFTDVDGSKPSGYCPEGSFSHGEFRQAQV